ncbi:MAG: ion transporter [Chloroflexota bacterium]|nr:ion transporter [Chloroflexota bacterium]
MISDQDQVSAAVQEERQQILDQISDALDKPMIALAFVWLGLVIVEFVGYRGTLLDILNYVIWAIFVFHFLLEFAIAPRKSDYLKRNWLTAIALVMPALRLVRIARLASVLRASRGVRGLRLLKVVSTVNRGIRALGKTIRRRGITYVVAITGLVTLLGAAGMYAFESPAEGGGLANYGEALWWTAMIMTTMGSEYWPQTAEGRILGWLLAVFAFAIFGYITATLASFFVGQDAEERNEQQLRSEIVALRDELRELRRDLEQRDTH